MLNYFKIYYMRSYICLTNNYHRFISVSFVSITPRRKYHVKTLIFSRILIFMFLLLATHIYCWVNALHHWSPLRFHHSLVDFIEIR
jgi:hypothetical protein